MINNNKEPSLFRQRCHRTNVTYPQREATRLLVAVVGSSLLIHHDGNRMDSVLLSALLWLLMVDMIDRNNFLFNGDGINWRSLKKSCGSIYVFLKNPPSFSFCAGSQYRQKSQSWETRKGKKTP